MTTELTLPQDDRFAEIARQPGQLRSAQLVNVEPPDLSQIFLPLNQDTVELDFATSIKITNAQELEAELERLRQHYAPFQSNLAPSCESTRTRINLDRFDWRLETQADLDDPGLPVHGEGEWESITIPHYGGPLGRARAYYRTVFFLPAEMLDGSLFIHFQGVDYIARVFVNGTCLGSHEGFFAPFEFEATRCARPGENELVVMVENDAICMGNDSWGEDGHLYEGDKIYAATGPGWDEPEVGWHHCPPGMGIYQSVWVEARSVLHIHDVFVRPLLTEERAEAWIEIDNGFNTRQAVQVELSVYGQNFKQTIHDKLLFDPGALMGPGRNDLRLGFEVPNPRLWDTKNPWLYQLQVRLYDDQARLLDARTCQFSMRSFVIDENSTPKGKFLLNGKPIRLRGANTMGFEQQDVMKQDWNQLRDDILLAKICHMNFWRLTQRPVQEEVYTFCDQLGLMTQTDLPLFGMLRRNQFAEAVRQAGEMERLVRSHPCNILVTYINEPFPDAEKPFAQGINPQRHLTRLELERFFLAADQVVFQENPDRMIKPVDGDYYPPAPGLPDNHCYCGWYNGHGVDLGRLHKGYWQAVKPGWYYGCGEFGSEGLDPVDLMYRRYPPDWLPELHENQSGWSPNQIVKAQTGNFHYIWFDTQDSVEAWVHASQQHQAWVTRVMTEALRRNSSLISCAIHLFIDAFPAGWMKAIMDCERQPKPAFFDYRDALTPLMVNLRSDRWAFFSGESIRLECWICNDLPESPSEVNLAYQVLVDGKTICAGQTEADIPVCDVAFQGYLEFAAPKVSQRSSCKIRAGLLDRAGICLQDSVLDVEIFPEIRHESGTPSQLYLLNEQGKAAQLCQESGWEVQFLSNTLEIPGIILIDDYTRYQEAQSMILDSIEKGSMAVFLELPVGDYLLPGGSVNIELCGMNPVHFVSRATDHALVADFKPNDFKFWHDSRAGYVTPLLTTTFTADGWTPILTTGNGGWGKSWGPALAAAEVSYGNGLVRLCQVALAGRTQTNPVVRIFANRLLNR